MASDEYTMLCPTCGGLPVDSGRLRTAEDENTRLRAALAAALGIASDHALVSRLDKSAPRDLKRIAEMRMEWKL